MKERLAVAVRVAITAFIGALAGGAIAPEHVQLVLKLIGF
jgi:hypothetical protein